MIIGDGEGAPFVRCPQDHLPGSIKHHRWMFEGGVHAAIVTFLPMAALGTGAVLPQGRGVGLWGYGLVVFLCVVVVANGRVAMENKLWTAVFASVFALSLVVCVLAWFVFAET